MLGRIVEGWDASTNGPPMELIWKGLRSTVLPYLGIKIRKQQLVSPHSPLRLYERGRSERNMRIL